MLELATDRLGRVLERIDQVARRAGRDPKDITLVAVTKKISLDNVLPYLQAGIRHIGENRVQEAITKYSDLRTATQQAVASRVATQHSEIPRFHLIGQLQSNKAKKAVGFFDMIQSLDRLDLADDIDRHAREAGKVMPCLVEVKISSEKTKSGVNPDALPDFLSALKTRTSLAVKGLMGIAPLDAAGHAARPHFARLRKLFESAKLEVLSMGMSSDFDVAIEEGSTMVRLGSVLFGARPH